MYLLSSSGDIGPSVPVNVPGLDDLLAKEQELLKKKEKEASDKSEKTPFERKVSVNCLNQVFLNLWCTCTKRYRITSLYILRLLSFV